MSPTVSVLMPTYNQALYLPRALIGLAEQMFRDFELIICDDGSTDSTSHILQGTSARVVTHTRNRGAAAAINSAAARASGSYMTWVSSDNVMRPDWLQTLVSHLDRTGDGAVYSAYHRIDNGQESDEFPGPYARERLISSENCFFGPSFLIRREVWQEHRGKSSHDYDNWARVEEACWARGLNIGYVNRVLCDYYAGPWCTARARPELYDAHHWRAEAITRRKARQS